MIQGMKEASEIWKVDSPLETPQGKQAYLQLDFRSVKLISDL